MTTKKTGKAIATVKNQTPSTDKGTKLVQNVDTILKHAEQLQSYTKQYNWLAQREKALQVVMDAYNKHAKKRANAKENIFEDGVEPFPYKIVVLEGNSNYIQDAIVEIQKPVVLGAFVNTLLEFIVEEKTRVFEKINELETAYAKNLTSNK